MATNQAHLGRRHTWPERLNQSVSDVGWLNLEEGRRGSVVKGCL